MKTLFFLTVILFGNLLYSSETPWFEGDYSLELSVYGASYHTDRSKEYNEVNPGIGLNLVLERPSQFDFLLSVGGYRDSNYGLYDGQKKLDGDARYAMVGIRKVFGNRDGFHFDVGASGGYFDGSDFNGIGGMLYGGIGYDRVTVCVTGVPEIEGINDTGVIAVFLNVKLFEF